MRHHNTLSGQWQLLRLLPRHPRKVTAGDLQGQLARDGYETTKRTIERNLNALSESFPILLDDREKPFGWSWKKDAPTLSVPGLTVPQALAFALAKRFLGPLLPASLVAELEAHFTAAEKQLAALPKSRGVPSWIEKVRTVPPAQPLLPPRIEWVGKAMENGKYYDTDCEYRGRLDQIYHRGRDRSLQWKRGATYHENGDIKDTGEHPPYKQARVLICDNFRYFGREAFGIHENNFSLIANLLASLKQGHLVNHDLELYGELAKLRDIVWERYPQKRIGRPTHKPDPKIRCNTTENDGSVEVACRN